MHWGNYIWYTFHLCSYTFDKNNKKKYINHFKLTGDLLPCLMCVNHFRIMISKTDLDYHFDDKDRLITWTNMIHNKVNKRLDKPLLLLNDSYNLYYKNNNILIDHQKLIEYIKIILENYNLNLIIKQKKIKTIQNFCYIFPCEICKEKLINFIENNEITTINNWQNKIINIIHEHLIL